MNYDLMLDQLKRHEGLRLFPYKCSEGYITIGYGRNLETNGLNSEEMAMLFGEQLSKLDTIERLMETGLTEEYAEELLMNDVAEVEDGLRGVRLLDGLNWARQAVLINMGFQLGYSGLMRFKHTLNYIKSGRYDDAAREMLDSRWCRQTPKRARELSEQMRAGEFA